MTFSVALDDVVRKNDNELLSIHPTWTRVRLGDVVDVLNGYPFSSDRFSNEYGTPLLRIRDVVRGRTETYYDGEFDPSYVVKPGELVVGMDGDFNSARWRGEPALLNQRVCKLTPNPEFVEPSFLDWVLPGYLNAINSATSSMTVKHLSSRTVADISLPLPPRNEQRRLAEKLDELFSDLDAGTTALERARANLKRYRAAVLKAAVEGRLTEKWRAAHPDVEPAEKLLERILAARSKEWEAAQLKKFAEKQQTPPKGWKDRYPEPVKPDTAALRALPKGWCWASLDQVAAIVGGITKGQKRAKGERLREVPYLRVANVQRGYLDLREMKSIEATESEIRELTLEAGDVLFNEGGDRDKLGRGWVWQGELPECIHQNHVFRARMIAPDIDPKFVSVHGNTFGRLWFQRTGKQSVNLASINMGILKRFPVPIAPADEQREAIAVVDQQLSVLDRNAETIERLLAMDGRLRQAVLKRAFEGKLVPQDPKDEPASELLARIRAARGREAKAVVRGQRKEDRASI